MPLWGVIRLANAVGRYKAKELMMTGDIISAEEAQKIGLVNKVVSQEKLLEEAEGIARKILTKALNYAKERVQFGQPIGKFQAIQFMLANMYTEIEAARLLIYRAAWMIDQGMKATREASAAKLMASETAMRTATNAMQIFGGYGYMKEYAIQRYFREAKLAEAGEGTSEVQRMIIAKHLGL